MFDPWDMIPFGVDNMGLTSTVFAMVLLTASVGQTISLETNGGTHNRVPHGSNMGRTAFPLCRAELALPGLLDGRGQVFQADVAAQQLSVDEVGGSSADAPAFGGLVFLHHPWQVLPGIQFGG